MAALSGLNCCVKIFWDKICNFVTKTQEPVAIFLGSCSTRSAALLSRPLAPLALLPSLRQYCTTLACATAQLSSKQEYNWASRNS